MQQLQLYSTDGLPPHRRLGYWNDITSSTITAQVATPVDPQAFRGRMTCLDLGDVRLVELNASGSTVTRTSRADGGGQPVYLVRLILCGEVTTFQDGQQLRLGPGDFSMCDTSRAYKLFFRQPSDILLMRIGRDQLLRYIARPEAMLGVVMPGDSGLTGLVSRQLRDLWAASHEFLTHGASARMVDIIMQLLASAGCAIPRARADRSCLAVAHRARIIEHIEMHLADPDLSPAAIAEKLKVTPGYLHRVFSGESDTIARYILRRRLEECARALRDPMKASLSVTAIAFRFGFSSSPHFSRAFRERYDMSPSQFRRA